MKYIILIGLSIIIYSHNNLAQDTIQHDTLIDYEYNDKDQLISQIKTVGDIKIKTDFYENGNTKNVCKFKNGKLHGIYKAYYENSDIQYVVNLKNSKKEGIAKFYYLNEVLQAREYYINDKKIGQQLYFDRDGNLTRIEVYDNEGYLIKKEELE